MTQYIIKKQPLTIMRDETICTTGSNPAGPTIADLGPHFFDAAEAVEFSVAFYKLNRAPEGRA